MKNNNALGGEKRTSQDIFIGGDFILKETQRIINTKEHISVQCQYNKGNEANINIKPKSFYAICSLINQNTEATIMNSFKFTYQNQTEANTQRHKPPYDSLLSDPMKSTEIHILDSNDLDPEAQYNLLPSSVRKRTTKEVNPLILDLFHHNFIAKEYTWIITLWKLLHAFFLLITTALLIHLSSLIKSIHPKDFVYLLIGIILSLSNYSIGVISLYEITIDMPYKACDDSFNYSLMIALILSAIELNIIPETIPQVIVDYMDQYTHYRLIHHLIIGVIVAVLLFNFKMKEFFNEYNDRLPVKHSLIPDRIEEDEVSDSDIEENELLNIYNNNKYTQMI